MAENTRSREALSRYVTTHSRLVWGPNVRRRRKQLGLTLESVAALADTSFQTVARVETGEIVPRDWLRWSLAAALAENPDTLFPAPHLHEILEDVA